MFKKILALGLIMSIALSLAACKDAALYNAKLYDDAGKWIHQEFLVENLTRGAYFEGQNTDDDSYPKSVTRLIKSKGEFDTIFSEFPIEIDFDKSMFEIDEDSVAVTFKYPEIVEKELANNRIKLRNDELNVELNGELNLSDNALKIIDIIKNNSSVTANEIADLINTSTRTVDRAIKELRDKNIIIREGSFKSGYWKIIK